MHVQKYLENLDHEINELINSESMQMTEKGEYTLHVLLENRKHVEKWKEMRDGNPHGGMMDENPKKSYFGGI